MMEKQFAAVVCASAIVIAALAGLAAPALAQAQTPAKAGDPPKVVIGMSGWTGFAPLTLAEKAGIFKKKWR